METSVVVTVRNEERNISDLLDSLSVQEGVFEVVIVDSYSTDRTRDIIRRYQERMENLHLYLKGGKRGACRNYGVGKAQYSHVAFIDGDVIANPYWLKEMCSSLESSQVSAGRTVQIGFAPFEDLERVELVHRGYDVTYPSCNLAYEKETFLSIGGFDPEFVTAEDIDLNYRAVGSGAHMAYNPDAVVYHRTRSSYYSFFKQAFWNGFGRKQLTLKHGRLWSRYRPHDLARNIHTFWGSMRFVFAMAGYMACKLCWEPPPSWKGTQEGAQE